MLVGLHLKRSREFAFERTVQVTHAASSHTDRTSQGNDAEITDRADFRSRSPHILSATHTFILIAALQIANQGRMYEFTHAPRMLYTSLHIIQTKVSF